MERRAESNNRRNVCDNHANGDRPSERVMERVRDTRGGEDHDSTFGRHMGGAGPMAELLAKRFQRLGFPGFPALDGSGFAPPLPERGQPRCRDQP